MRGMKTNILVTATRLSDQDLLTRLQLLANKERESTVDLVAHLAALDSRPAVYAAQGYGSLFSYCTQALRLSEDAACNRIEAARACRRFPLILDLLASGEVSLTAVRLLGRHLTAENHEAILVRAKGRSRQQVEVIVAELAPRPDVPTSVRRLPTLAALPVSAATAARAPDGGTAGSAAGDGPAPAVFVPAPRPVIQPTAPQRYRVQFTIGQEAHERLRRIQALLRREIPDGDPGVIFDRAMILLLEKVEKKKLGAATKPRARQFIRPGTDRSAPRSREAPREVKRVVWRRDAGQCAYVAPSGRRCSETTFLEFHHVQPHAFQGPPTVDNIALRCWRHNQYEAELIFGSRRRRDRNGTAVPDP
jgi:5-methylcytosine-specific restriction endonuclease McrA